MKPENSIEPVTAVSLEIPQEKRGDVPEEWIEKQREIANEAGLAVLLVDGYQPPALVVSHNNSICHSFQSSAKLVSLCDPFCGAAHRRATSAGTRVDYKCHAGLQCFAKPLRIGNRKLVAIGGRAFVTGSDYRSLVERFRAGELNELLPGNPFDNVIFAEPEKLEQLDRRLDKATRRFDTDHVGTDTRAASGNSASLETFSASQKPEESTEQANGGGTSKPPSNELQREVDRLRGELQYRATVDESLQGFLERINSTDARQTYESILKNSKELLRAERASLWAFDETADEIILRARHGLPDEIEMDARQRLGKGISSRALESGQPLLVENIDASDFEQTPSRNYRTKSFISYPLSIGSRKIGLLNVTDKSNGKHFDEVDLNLLEMIGPQIAVALERAEWQERAAQFQLMSITDPLTGLLNRRYLEERLTEELNRSRRYNYSMSCLMIDIDDFKKYNDTNGHQAGDLALKITAHSLKAALRSADIACRYGGEEFCILLPQTSVSEAGVIAERMRLKVTETEYPHGKSQPMGTVSISIGISTLGRHIDTAESIIAAADRALYNAKRLGKNRIEFYVDNLTDMASNQ